VLPSRVALLDRPTRIALRTSPPSARTHALQPTAHWREPVCRSLSDRWVVNAVMKESCTPAESSTVRERTRNEPPSNILEKQNRAADDRPAAQCASGLVASSTHARRADRHVNHRDATPRARIVSRPGRCVKGHRAARQLPLEMSHPSAVEMSRTVTLSGRGVAQPRRTRRCTRARPRG
jgi:hypothetical protein